MKWLLYLSDLMIPILIFYIVAYGLLAKREVYRDFLDGAKDGLRTAAGICPALVGLLTAVGILRASGFLDFLGDILGQVTQRFGMPSELVPLSVVRLFSSSAATGLLLDIFKKFGADSEAGLMGSLILSATESVFYCMSIYFASVKISKTRYTLPGALLSAAAGVAASVMIVRWM